MPIARVQMPDGRIGRFEVPEGTQPEEVEAFVGQMQTPQEETAPIAQEYTAPEAPISSIGRTVLDQSLQGATFGGADEITDRIGAGIASLYTGDKYSDTLKQSRDLSKTRLQNEFEQRPVLSIGANLGGALLTGAAGASTKAGNIISNSLRSGNLPARITKGVASGSTSGALYGAGTADEGNRIEGARQGAIVGGVLGGTAPALANVVKATSSEIKNIYKGFKARDAEELQAVESAIKQKSSEAYQKMRDTGSVLSPRISGRILTQIDRNLNKSGKLNDKLHGDTLSVFEDIKDAARKGKIELEELDQYRQLLGDVVRKNTTKLEGSNPDAFKAQQAIEAIDDIVENIKPVDLVKGDKQAVEALNTARSEWGRYKKFNKVSLILEKSEGDANYIKRELKKLYDDPKRRRGFNAKEVSVLKEASRLSTTEGILKSLGKFGFDIGGPSRIGNTALPIGGIALGQPGLTAAGTVARQSQKYIARGKAEELLRTIEGSASKTPIRNTGLPATITGDAAVLSQDPLKIIIPNGRNIKGAKTPPQFRRAQ